MKYVKRQTKSLETELEINDTKYLFGFQRKVSRNMYLFDIRYRLLCGIIPTYNEIYNTKITQKDDQEFCNEMETNVHAFLLCDRAVALLMILLLGLDNYDISILDQNKMKCLNKNMKKHALCAEIQIKQFSDFFKIRLLCVVEKT